MKKQIKYSAIFFVAMMAFSCSTDKIENDWTKDNLRGKVKSFSEVSYEAVSRFGKIEKGERKIIEFGAFDSHGVFDVQKKYDEKGNRIEESKYNSDGELLEKRIYQYEYDSRGNWVKRITSKDEKPEYILVREYEYYK